MKNKKQSNQVRIAFTADSHIGTRGYGLLRREQDFAQAALEVVQKAILNGCHAIINAGDILDSNRPSPEAIRVLKEMNRLTTDADIPLFCISGNHDACGGGTHWIDLIQTGAASGIQLIDNRTVTFRELKIHGVPSMGRENFLDAMKGLKIADILVAHQPVQEFASYPSSSYLTIEELPLDKCQCVLLGDLHVNDFRKVRDTWVGYPGSSELKSQGEPDEKSFKVLIFEDGNYVGHEDIGIQTRPVVRKNIKTEDELTELIAQMFNTYPADQKQLRAPIMYVGYPSGGLDVKGRLDAALDTDRFIIRAKPYLIEQEIAKTTTKSCLTPMEFLRDVMKPDKEIETILIQLLDREAHADDALNGFVDAQLGGQV